MAEGRTTTSVIINLDDEGEDDDINALFNRVANKLGWLEKQLELQDCSSTGTKCKKTRKYSRKKQAPNEENTDPNKSRENAKARSSSQKTKPRKGKQKKSEVISNAEKNVLTPSKDSIVLHENNTGRQGHDKTNPEIKNSKGKYFSGNDGEPYRDATSNPKRSSKKSSFAESKITNDLLDQDLDELYDSDTPLPNVCITYRKDERMSKSPPVELVTHLDLSCSVSPLERSEDGGPSPPPNASISLNTSLDHMFSKFNENINSKSELDSKAMQNPDNNGSENRNKILEYVVIDSGSELDEDIDCDTSAKNHVKDLSKVRPKQDPESSSQKCKLNSCFEVNRSRSNSPNENHVKFTESPEPMKWLLSPSSQIDRPIKSDVTGETNKVSDVDSDDDYENHRILSLKDRLKSKWQTKTAEEKSSGEDKRASETRYRSSSNILDSSSEDDFESFLASIRTPSMKTKTNQIVDEDEDFINDDRLSISSDDDEYLHVRLSQNDEVFTSSSKNKTGKELRKEGTFKSFDLDDDDDDFTGDNNVFTTPKGLRNTKKVSGNDSVFKTLIRFPTSGAKPIKRRPKAISNPTCTFKTPAKTCGVTSSSSVSFSPPHSTSFLKSLSTPYKGTSSSSSYINNFKSTRDELIKKLFAIYNDTVFENKLPSDFKITWNKRMRKTAGFCYYSQNRAKKQRFSRIELSDKVCDSAERLRDTLIHELCHAAAWLIHGVSDGHGKFWKYWAAKANLAHPEIPVISRCHSYVINTKFKYDCSTCGYTIGRHSKSLDTSKFRCGCCRGQLILRPQLDKSGKPVKPRAPSKFALYVKDNYGMIKKDNERMKHADIMRVLSQEFSNKAKINK